MRYDYKLTACFLDFPDAFISFNIFSCFSYAFSCSFLFCINIFLKVAEVTNHYRNIFYKHNGSIPRNACVACET